MISDKINKAIYDKIIDCKDLKNHIENNKFNFIDTTAHQHLQVLLDEKNISKTDLVKMTGIEKSYLYQILSGRRNPSRNKLLRITLAMKLSLDETQQCLIIAEKNILFPINKRDTAIICAIQNNYSLDDTQLLLYEYGIEILK